MLAGKPTELRCSLIPCPLQATLERGAWSGRSQHGLVSHLCGASFSGKFREKASILHKIAKKKCQVEDSEKANGVASRSGTRPGGHMHILFF